MSDSEPLSKKLKLEKIENYQEQEKTEDFSVDVTSNEDGFSMASDKKYGNEAKQDEVQRLKEFQILDEVKSNDEESDARDSDSTDENADIPDEEIEKLLEESWSQEIKDEPKKKQENIYSIKQKTILEEKGVNTFEVLPLDWIMIRHITGMPVYLHKPTRVCTLSKPYFIGQKGSAIRHEVPISAIPCLNYRRALEEEEKQRQIDEKIAEQIKQMTKTGSTNDLSNDSAPKNVKEIKFDPDNTNGNIENEESSVKTREDQSEHRGQVVKCPFLGNSLDNTSVKMEVVESESNDAPNSEQEISNETKNNNEEELPLSSQPVVLPGGLIMPPPRVETVNNNWKTQPLTHEQLSEYCSRLFKFKTIKMMHFKRWIDRHKYTKMRKAMPYSTLPQGTKVITIPAQPVATQVNGNGTISKANRKDWVMNMNGRSYLCVFHEYVQRALQKQPVYEFKQIENASTPYQATVYIGGMQYGVGYGSSKRQAKSAAARASIRILIPEMRDKLDDDEPTKKQEDDPVFSFFDCVGIEDPRIMEFCASTMEPSPHAILRTCLLRNFGSGDRQISCESKKLEHQRIELTMKVGKHSATVVAKNKKMAKQRASQAILQALHPHVKSWGSLLRLYGSRSIKSSKERKLEEQQITLLQDKARHNEPNYAVLEKLRTEMQRLKERDEAMVPIGTLLVTDDLPTHSGSNLNNVDL